MTEVINGLSSKGYDLKENYVDVDLALKLRDMGFDEPCHAYCSNTDAQYPKIEVVSNARTNTYWKKEYPLWTVLSIPTLQMVQKWLLINNGLFINSWVIPDHGYWFGIYRIKEGYSYEDAYISIQENIYFSDPFSAIEGAIRYCIKNIIS